MMRWWLLLPLACTGCASMWDGLWIFHLGTGSAGTETSSCEENFVSARCAGASSDDTGDWTITDDLQVTPSLIAAELVEGYGRDLWLVWKGKLLPVQRKGGTLSGTWNGTTDGAHEEDHRSGYTWRFTETSRTTVDILLERAPKHLWVGKIRETLETTRTWAESDEWDPERVGFVAPRIATFTGQALEDDGGADDTGGASDDGTLNVFDEVDCQADLCTGGLEATHDVTWEVVAQPSRSDDEPGSGTYDGLETPEGGGWTVGD